MNVLIQHGRVIDPANQLDAVMDIAIVDGAIASVGAPPAGFIADQTIDATGLIACPGLVDAAARLREPGFGYQATLKSELQAAAAGGITSVVCPPDTEPVLDEPGLVSMLKQKARQYNLARIYPMGALTKQLNGQTLTPMNELHEAGCVGFSQANRTIIDTQVLLRAMQYAATFDFGLWLRAEDVYLAKDGVAHDGEVATRLGLKGIPTVAETLALATLLQLAKITGVRLHISRISSADGVQMIRQAKAEGLSIRCDVSIHHLHLTEMDIGYFNADCHMVPPLRTQRDREALAAGLADGTIDLVCSDHTPVNDDAKLLPFAEAEAGASGLELLLPLTLKWAEEKHIPLVQALSKVTSEPARVLKLKTGALSVGKHADICLFDPNAYWRIEPKTLVSHGKNTPFKGYEVKGRVKYTLLNGRIVYQDRH